MQRRHLEELDDVLRALAPATGLLDAEIAAGLGVGDVFRRIVLVARVLVDQRVGDADRCLEDVDCRVRAFLRNFGRLHDLERDHLGRAHVLALCLDLVVVALHHLADLRGEPALLAERGHRVGQGALAESPVKEELRDVLAELVLPLVHREQAQRDAAAALDVGTTDHVCKLVLAALPHFLHQPTVALCHLCVLQKRHVRDVRLRLQYTSRV